MKTKTVLPILACTIFFAGSCGQNDVPDSKEARVYVPDAPDYADPAMWRTDATPGVLDDTITITLDSRAKLLIVLGYDGSALPNIFDILNVGDYHGAEPWFYSESLRRNFRARLRNWK